MQNFYDVLLRRFIAVGDAISSSGDGGPDLGRYEQLNSLTKILYVMSQDSPECAGAVWSRRLGIFQKGERSMIFSFDVITFLYSLLVYISLMLLDKNEQHCRRDYAMLKSPPWEMLVRGSLLLGHLLECCYLCGL